MCSLFRFLLQKYGDEFFPHCHTSWSPSSLPRVHRRFGRDGDGDDMAPASLPRSATCWGGSRKWGRRSQPPASPHQAPGPSCALALDGCAGCTPRARALRGCSRVAASHRAPCLLGYDARTTRRTGLKAQFHELRHRCPPTYSPLSKTQSTSMTQKVLSPGFPPIPRAHAKRYCHHVPASGFREVPRHVAAGVRLPVPNTAFSRCPVTRIRGTCQEWPRHSYWRAACHRAHPGLATPTPVHSDHRTCPLT